MFDERDDSAPRSTPAGRPENELIPLASVRPAAAPRLDLAALRARLEGETGRRYWRSLEELAGAPQVREQAAREFPTAPREMLPVSRREFMRVMGATLALAGASGCAMQPPERIVPYTEQPENLVPGKPLFYSTAFARGGYGIGVLGESHMGRPIKLEGNPDHPSSLGATDYWTQASLLGLYDPDRSQAVRSGGVTTGWERFLGEMLGTEQGDGRLAQLRRTRGAGLRFLLPAATSPTLADQLAKLKAKFPEAGVHVFEPAGRANVHEGARLAFGRPANPVYHFDRAARVLALECNFLLEEPGSVRYARDFARGRTVRDGNADMNRLYVAESAPTLTGGNADHRVPLAPAVIAALAHSLAEAVESGSDPAVPGVPGAWLKALLDDLRTHRGASLVVAGPALPPDVHAAVFALNQALGNVGKTLTFTAPLEVPAAPFADLVAALSAGKVDTLVILGGNPVYAAPADVNFAELIQRPRLRIHLGPRDDETGVLCQWHIPESHFLEAWSDVRGHDGLAAIVQPLITPLYQTKSIHEVLSVFIDPEPRSGYDIVREHWLGTNPAFLAPQPPPPPLPVPGEVQGRSSSLSSRPPQPSEAFEKFWHKALTGGVVPNSRPAALAPGPARRVPASAPGAPGDLEIAFRPDPALWDGCYANNGWLQELPKHVTALTWDNAAQVSPRLAEALKLATGDRVELAYGGRTLNAVALVTPGQADACVTLHLGYGRTRAGKIGTGPGFNAYALQTAAAPGGGPGLQVKKTAGSYPLAIAQHHWSMEGRDIVKVAGLGEFLKDPEHPHFMHSHHAPATIYDDQWPSDEIKEPGETGPGEWRGRGYNGLPVPAWGMVIDLGACTGCGACTIACQAENNIPTVGKDQVLNNREMHWIRVDTYFTAGLDNPEPVFQPVPCMHCEKAPCEPVCPVAATSHSVEGINEMTYNRCIGTRYCSNNCPYHVRRFNFLQYSDQQTPVIQMQKNPDVTVRSRGVMEKCTFCIQRINQARIEAEKEVRTLKDGDVLTACQQACPSGAILFGNVNDRTSKVRELKGHSLNYRLLEELGTRPRTSYLAKLRNPHPSLAPAGSHDGGHGAATPGGRSPGAGDGHGQAPAGGGDH